VVHVDHCELGVIPVPHLDRFEVAAVDVLAEHTELVGRLDPLDVDDVDLAGLEGVQFDGDLSLLVALHAHPEAAVVLQDAVLGDCLVINGVIHSVLVAGEAHHPGQDRGPLGLLGEVRQIRIQTLVDTQTQVVLLEVYDGHRVLQFEGAVFASIALSRKYAPIVIVFPAETDFSTSLDFLLSEKDLHLAWQLSQTLLAGEGLCLASVVGDAEVYYSTVVVVGISRAPGFHH